MIISKSSIHYKFVSKVFYFPSKSLCVYFWQVVWSFFMLILVVPTLTILGTVIMFLPLLNPFVSGIKIPAAFIGCVEIWILLLVWQDLRKELYPPKQRKPTIVGEFIRAKKQKICPRLIFED